MKDAEWIFCFFGAHRLHIENCRTSTVGLVIRELEESNLSNMQRNSIMTTLGNMVELCESYGLTSGTGIVDCSHRWKDTWKRKRAQDACVIEQLDSYFFDPGIIIPLQYRTVYMLLRLISNRISEVLFMSINCITYPDVDTYSISIPTQKATAYHMPEYHHYPKKLSGREEGYLYRCICELQEYARSCQNYLECQHQELLFVSSTGRTIVTTADVNKYLKCFCAAYNIKDASGTPTAITTHDLRHTAVVERLKYGIISPYQTMRESAHRTISQTMAYGYASEHDETKRLSQISRELLKEYAPTQPIMDDASPREITPKKFLALKEDPNTRLLLDGSICLSRSCKPSFDECSSCKSFQVDPMYQEPLKNYITLLTDRSQMLKNKGGNPDTILFIENQVDVYTKMLNKIIGCSKSEERKIS